MSGDIELLISKKEIEASQAKSNFEREVLILNFENGVLQYTNKAIEQYSILNLRYYIEEE